jgi:hypothetical protein
MYPEMLKNQICAAQVGVYLKVEKLYYYILCFIMLIFPVDEK